MIGVLRGRWPALLVLFWIGVAPLLVARFTARIVYMDNWPDGSPKLRAVSMRTPDGVFVFDGDYRAYHADGTEQIRGNYRQGVEEGSWVWTDSDGREIARCDYRDGEGEYRSWHADGSTWWQGTMRRGERIGEWQERDAAGRLLKQGHYVDGELDGSWRYLSYADSSGEATEFTGLWRRGDLLESDGGFVRAPYLRLGWGEHLLGTFFAALLFVCPWPLACVAFRGRGPGERALGRTVLAVALWVGLGMLLGTCGLLSRTGLAIGCTLLLGLGWWRGGMRACRDWFAEIGDVAWSPAERALLCAVGATLGVAAMTTWLEPTVNFDSLAYHLPVVADWMQNGWLRGQPELGQTAYYAFGFELLSTLNAIALGGDAMSAWPNLLFLALALASVYVVARQFDCSRSAAMAIAACLLLVPEFFRRAGAVQPDIALAACFVAALALRGTTWPFWLSVGLTASMKMSGLGYALLAIGLSWSTLRRSWQPLAVLCALVLGGFWLARNQWLTGNPLGVVDFGPWSGSVSVDSLRAGSLARTLSITNAAHRRIVLDALYGVLGWSSAILLLLAAWGWVRRRTWTLFGILGAWALYMLAPYSADNGQHGNQLTPWMANNVRFAFPALLALTCAAAAGVAHSRRLASWLWLLPALAGAWSVAHTIAPRFLVLTCLLLGLAVWLLIPRVRVAVLVAGLLLIVVAARTGRELRQEARLSLYGSAYEWCERRVPADATVGILLSERRYPWVGPRLTRRVVDAAPTSEESSQQWLARLEGSGVSALVVGTSSPTAADAWIEERFAAWSDQPTFPFTAVGAFDSQKRDERLYLRGDQ